MIKTQFDGLVNILKTGHPFQQTIIDLRSEGGIDPVLCVNPENSSQPCEKSGDCVTRKIWNEAGKRLREYFDSVTIKDLCNMAHEMGIKKELDRKFMYYI